MLVKKKDAFFKIKNIKVSIASAVSYISDWFLYAVLIVVFSFYRIYTAPRYHEFSLADDRYAYTFYNDQNVLFANTLLLLISLLAPIVYILGQFSFPKKSSKLRKLWNIHCGLLGFIASHCLQVIVVSIMKNNIGMPRPDMLARCMPRSFEVAPIGSLSNVGICINPNIGVINDGFRSFPSGHSSTSFCSATYSFFIFATRNHIFGRRHKALKLVLGALPFIAALFVTSTRYSDNRHFLLDLFIGSMIGAFGAYIGYHMYFPYYRGNERNNGNAYPPRRISFNGKKDKFKFWKLPKDVDYQYDSDAMSMDDDVSLQAYFSSDDTSLGTASAENTLRHRDKMRDPGPSKEWGQKGDVTGEVHHHTQRTHKSSRPQSKARPATQTTTYTVKLKELQQADWPTE